MNKTLELRSDGKLVVLGTVELVTDERPPSDHLADGEDAVSLNGIDSDLLPLALGQELGPERLVGGLGVDLTICGEDGVERGGRGEGLGNVDLLGDGRGDGEVVLDGLGVTC